tara:strand:- start:118 stop:1443 length:1326 start_codon:yes stop_codon:yes gene_type:complete
MRLILYIFILSSINVFSQCNISIDDLFICNNQTAITSIEENLITSEILNSYDYEFIDFEYDTLLKSIELEIGDDDVIGPFQLGFNFSFYNQNYDQFWLSSNGFISFTEPTNTYTPNPIPNSSGPFSAIFGAFEDWNPSAGGNISYSSLPNRLVVEYKNISSYNCGGDDNYAGTFQIVLYKNTNWIDIRIVNKEECTNSLQGIQNHNGLFASVVDGRNSSLWSSTMENIRFKPRNINNVQWYNSNNDLIYSGNPFIYNTDSTEEITVVYNDYKSCLDTTTFVINVSFTTPQIFSEGQVLLCDLSGYNYQWLLNDEIIDNANSQYYIPQENGLYSVLLTNSLGCEEISANFLFENTTAKKNYTKNKLSVFPNPSSGKFILSLDLSYKSEIIITNLMGKIIYYELIESAGNYTKRIDLNKYSIGIYNLALRSSKETINYKLILN